MSDLAVKYHNDMNTVAFKKFNAVELDLFFTICANIKDNGTNTVTYNFDKLKELSSYSRNDVVRFVDDLKRTNRKLLDLNFEIVTEHKIVQFVLFTNFEIDLKNKTLEISVNERFKYLLNELTSNFTSYELSTFNSLKSTYSKTMYRLLKQFRSTGYYKVHIDEFRRLLDVPESYPMNNIDKFVLNPIKKELPAYFKNLTIKKEKAKKGNKIEYIIFTFDKERATKRQTTIEYEKANADITQEEIDDLINEFKRDN